MNNNGKMKGSERIYSLDFIKIVATFFILFHHYQQIMGVHFSNGINYYGGIFYFGYMVELFFLISGFLAAVCCEGICAGTIKFKSFIIRKYIRFVSVCFFAAWVYQAADIWRYKVDHIYTAGKTDFWDVVEASFLINRGGAFPASSVNNPTWYVSVLLKCLILFYFLTWCSKAFNVDEIYFYLIMILIGCCILVTKTDVPYFNNPMARGYICFFCGIVIRRILYDNKYDLMLRKRLFGKTGLMIFITVFVTTLFWLLNADSPNIRYVVMFVFIPSLVLLFLNRYIQQILNHKILGLLGKISFDTYVWHICLMILIININSKMHLGIDFQQRYIMYIYATFAWCIGMLSYYLIEKSMGKIYKNLVVH